MRVSALQGWEPEREPTDPNRGVLSRTSVVPTGQREGERPTDSQGSIRLEVG
jgi:hypothetical protein